MKICDKCGQTITDELLRQKETQRRKRISRALRGSSKKGINVGRKRSVNYQTARELYKSLKSYRKTAAKLSVSIGTVWAAVHEKHK